MLERLRDFLEAAFRRKRFEDEMSSELRFHIETYTADLVRSGVPRAEAERRARLEFGGLEGVREQCRQSRGLEWPDEVARSIRFALRTLRKSPTFTITAVVTLALGIGANTAIFSVVNSVLLRPLPYPEPERLYAIQETDSRLAETHPLLPVNGRHFDEWRRRCSSCEAITLLFPHGRALTGEGQPQELSVVGATADIFPMLGLPVQRGRALTREDEVPGKNQALLISDALWRQRFGGDPGIVGRKIVLNGDPREIVGVLGPGFWLPKGLQLDSIVDIPARIDAILPLALRYEEIRPMGNHMFPAIVRLKPQATHRNRPLPKWTRPSLRCSTSRSLRSKHRSTR